MILVDKRILVSGIVMIIVGMGMLVYNNSMSPISSTNMTDEEIQQLYFAQIDNQNIQTLTSILSGIGFLLILVSFGVVRRKGDSNITKKIVSKKS